MGDSKSDNPSTRMAPGAQEMPDQKPGQAPATNEPPGSKPSQTQQRKGEGV